MKRGLFSCMIIAVACSLFAQDVDILSLANWSASADDMGSTAEVAVTDAVKADFNQVAQPDPNTWPWVSLLAEVAPIADNLAGITSVKITYKCNVEVSVRLPMPSLSADGATHRAQIPAASSFSTETLATGDFKQPDWVSPTTDLDLSKVLGVEFVPLPPAATGGEATLELNEVVLSGLTTPVVTNMDKTVSNRLSIGNITAECITISIPLNGAYSVSLYSVNGRMYTVITSKFFSQGAHEIFWNGKDISTGIYLIQLRSGQDRVVKKLLLK